MAHMTGSFPTSVVMRRSSETIAGSGVAAAETFRPKEAVGPGSSAMSNNLCGAFYWVFSDLSRFWRGSDSDLHKDFCSGPDRIIWPNVADN